MMFQERLKELTERIEGARVVSLVAGDGIAVETYGAANGLDVEALAAELLAQTRAISGDHGDLDVGRVRQFSITTDRYTILISALAGDYFLLLVLGQEGGYGRARFELRRARLRFEDDLV